MLRTLLWIIAGILLGVIIHVIVILGLPVLAARDTWSKLAVLEAENRFVVLDKAEAGAPNPFRLDPELSYAICRLDLSERPGAVTGVLPHAFWSVAIFGRSGSVLYSTTNRDGIGRALDLGLFNAAQTRLLAEQRLDVQEGLLVIESREDDVYVLVRLAPPHQAMRARFETALSGLRCGNIG